MVPTARRRRTSEGPLALYREKRDFSKTSEPEGAARPVPGHDGAPRRFVVQRHRARRLHYDFRLEIDGVLASWAVPKGPTLDPSVRRAAFHVEDHPLEYFDFEGVIPAGEYGGGDVIVWDLGTWEADEAGEPPDPGTAVRSGELHLDLQGQKLRGRFVLVRTRPDPSGKEQWLLLHKHDEYAVDGWDPEDHPRSVLSGRTNDEVRAEPHRVWHSDLPPDKASVPLPPAAAAKVAAAPATADELGALDLLGHEGIWAIFGRELKVTNLNKVLFPPGPDGAAVTKRDFLRYSAQIAPVLLPYLAGRALNMHRYPDGAGSPGFWHKELPTHAPDWVPRWDNPDAAPGDSRTYLVVDEPAALLWAANFGALEWHAWTSRTEQPNLPTYALVDVDPGDNTSWAELLVLARLHRAALEHLGVEGRPKLTGRRGVQVWIPIAPGPSFSETRAWTEQLSRTIGAVVPQLVSWKWQVGERSGLARLDYTQNAHNKTLVAPYSPRAAPGAPVSAPVEWDELDDPDLRPDAFNIHNVIERLAQKGDLFRPVLQAVQRLPPFR